MRSEADIRLAYKAYKAISLKDTRSAFAKGVFDALAWVLEEEGL